MNRHPRWTRGAAVATLSLALLSPCQAADERPTDPADIAGIRELRRAVDELRAQNRALALRLGTLEAEKAARDAVAATPAAPADATAAADAQAGAVPPTGRASTEELTRRVRELEIAKIANEDATRAIIRDSVSTLGSKINESVSLGGAVEILAGRTRDFSGTRSSSLQLSTAELDLDIQVNPWTVGRLVIGYTDGSSVLFRDTRGFDSSVDRFTVETASITIGDLQRFPLYLRAGHINLAFGSSTGVHRSDVLSIESPLTTDAFELRRTAIGIGFGVPTPPLTRSPLPVVVPPVRGMVLTPLVDAFGRRLGYSPPPERPRRPVPVQLPVDPPPFYGSLYVYQGHNVGSSRGFIRNLNARLGYRAGGSCGKNYSQLRSGDLCPWALDINVDYNSSIFDGRFLQAEFRPFLDQFGPVRGMASTVKLSLGPLLLVGEWNGAIGRAEFDDDLGVRHSIRPSAWQLAMGYQFGWNPWIESIGGQGSYLALGYSRSNDLPGAKATLATETSRVGFLPRERWTLTAGEWVAEGLKVQIEYAQTLDYAIAEGGTGARGHGIHVSLTYSW